ncbi:hypothetical protein L7F22_039774 [Adiantum nelumboides]|nr:hypothetical protein [Adiantum nelumboides]
MVAQLYQQSLRNSTSRKKRHRLQSSNGMPTSFGIWRTHSHFAPWTAVSTSPDVQTWKIFVSMRSLAYLAALNSSPWLTTNASKACLFLATMRTHHASTQLPHLTTHPHWNGGLNHVIATLADKWSLAAPPPQTNGNASVLASCLYETTHRPGFDISIPFAESDPAMLAMHNGKDVIFAVTCNQVTNNKIRSQDPDAGKGCGEDELHYKQYQFKELMNSTFGLAPAGTSAASYRLIETISAGAIPVLVSDNYVKPFEGLIQWHRCALQFPTSEIARILPALQAMSREEMEGRQRYCLFIYREYLRDDATLVSAVVKSLKLRFNGILPQFNVVLPVVSSA